MNGDTLYMFQNWEYSVYVFTVLSGAKYGTRNFKNTPSFPLKQEKSCFPSSIIFLKHVIHILHARDQKNLEIWPLPTNNLLLIGKRNTYEKVICK
jgi:hypothetical protein